MYPTSHHNPGQTDVPPIAGPAKGQALKAADVKTVDAVFVSNPTVKRIGNIKLDTNGTPSTAPSPPAKRWLTVKNERPLTRVGGAHVAYTEVIYAVVFNAEVGQPEAAERVGLSAEVLFEI